MDVNSVKKIFEGDPNNPEITEEGVIDVVYKGGPVVSIYTGRRYAQFHDEFVQIAPEIPVLRNLIDMLKIENYSMNLD